MTGYYCKKCAMKIKSPVCGRCGKELGLKSIDIQGKKTQICHCPTGCGQIKSPQCCGQDMEPEHSPLQK